MRKRIDMSMTRGGLREPNIPAGPEMLLAAQRAPHPGADLGQAVDILLQAAAQGLYLNVRLIQDRGRQASLLFKKR